jgi:hypothetical protein
MYSAQILELDAVRFAVLDKTDSYGLEKRSDSGC